MKYWVYMNGEVPGCFLPQDLAALKGFTMTTLVCPAEGEILEKNWRRSGEFPDIVKLLQECSDKHLALPPSLAQEAALTADVNQILDTTSARLFSHVSQLMKELENHREEKGLLASLQHQAAELKDQLLAAQDKIYALEARIPRIAELEEVLRKDESSIANLESALKAREDGLSELRLHSEKGKLELENTKRRLGESLNDLSIRNRLVDKLSRDLTEKELSLAKSLAVIRRLEEDLNRLCPPIEAAVIQSANPEPAEKAQASPPEAAIEVNTIPEAPAPASHQPAAQDALIEKFRSLISRYDH